MRRDDPLWRAELWPRPLEPNPFDAWLVFLLRLWVCGQRSCVVHIPTGGPALARRWLAFTGRGQRRSATGLIDHDHPVRRMATTGSTDRRERVTCKQPGPVNPGTTLVYEGPRRRRRADALNAGRPARCSRGVDGSGDVCSAGLTLPNVGARRDASLRAPGGAACSRPPSDHPKGVTLMARRTAYARGGAWPGRTLCRLKPGPQGPDGPLPMERAGRSRPNFRS